MSSELNWRVRVKCKIIKRLFFGKSELRFSISHRPINFHQFSVIGIEKFFYHFFNYFLLKYLRFNGSEIGLVNSFKLLGVTIDNKLNFLEHVSNLRHTINKKLYSIKRLFYLNTSVKIQFFKSFILPFFDYCLSIIIYFPRVAIQKLANCFYLALYKLFKFNYNSFDPIVVNNFLEKYGLFSFQHRVILKLFSFSHKILNNCNSPTGLSSQFKKNSSLNKNYNLRNKDKFFIPSINKNCGEDTFAYFFSNLFNKFLKEDDFLLKSKFFSQRIFNNIIKD